MDLSWLSLLCHWFIRAWLSSWRQGKPHSIPSPSPPLSPLSSHSSGLAFFASIPLLPCSLLMCPWISEVSPQTDRLAQSLPHPALKPFRKAPRLDAVSGPPHSGLSLHLELLSYAFPSMCLLCHQLGLLSPAAAPSRRAAYSLFLPVDSTPAPKTALPGQCTQLCAVITS